MAKSQNAFIKKQKEMERAKKKKEKQEKKEARKSSGNNGPTIDWDSAPVNKTLTNDEERQKNQTEKQSNNQ
ncbi:MAG: cold-shock protein [Flavobacteriales bacterium]|nr:cold-shock protein [Flavobacteriales bacterium]